LVDEAPAVLLHVAGARRHHFVKTIDRSTAWRAECVAGFDSQLALRGAGRAYDKIFNNINDLI
jgi:hypothetical protein